MDAGLGGNAVEGGACGSDAAYGHDRAWQGWRHSAWPSKSVQRPCWRPFGVTEVDPVGVPEEASGEGLFRRRTCLLRGDTCSVGFEAVSATMEFGWVVISPVPRILQSSAVAEVLERCAAEMSPS